MNGDINFTLAKYNHFDQLFQNNQAFSSSKFKFRVTTDEGQGHINSAYDLDQHDYQTDDHCSTERTDEDEEPDPDYDSSYHTISLPDSVNQSSNLIVDEQNAKNKFQHGEIRNKRSTKRNSMPKTWDVFTETSKDNLTSSEIDTWNKVFKVTKVIFSLILFCCVLGTAVISKSTLFLIISNIIPPSTLQNSSLKSANNHFRYVTSDTAITWIWSLVLIVIAPYFLTVLFSVWTLIFKKTRKMKWRPLFVAILVETVHSVGLNIFIFALLPTVDPFTGVFLCMNVALLPSLLGLIYSGTYIAKSERALAKVLRRVTRTIALVAAIVTLAVWCVYVYRLETERIKSSPGLVILFVISPVLVSVSWWENFVPQGDEDSHGLRKFKRQLRSRRTKVSALVNIWKIIMTIGTVSIIYGIDCEEGRGCLETLYNAKNNATLSSKTFGLTHLVRDNTIGTCTRFLPLLVAAVNIASSAVCYRCCVAAVKIVSQVVSFSTPLVLTTPFTAAFIIGLYSTQNLKITSGCSLPFPTWEGNIEFDWSMVLASVMGYLAVMLITSYIWSPSNERMQREEKMFVQPLYCGVLFDQGMLLNRRKDDYEDMKGVDEKEKLTVLPIPKNLDDWSPGDEWSPLREDDTPFVYLCATMWHETENEMTQILKSLFRMDEDQCARRNLQLFFGIKDPDYYEFEAHIFFDDAFEYQGETARANGYVKQLIRTIDVAISSVHSYGMKIPPPSKTDTPYGGRLIWRLPGGNKLIAHMKDKSKIRHRKRWSQVMYMYYFLGHKLLSLGGGKEKLKTIADNTFLLALDGDVDFQPSALRLLIDRMKRNPQVGAACGRIHPIGSGPMVWYQKFEYAVSHWLQKATEHTIGCVLCSPGCFSLFRGSSVMDDNVMRRYTTPPTEPRHYVQYDQGEDRWLCTLLLQQGYRVEYCAASDALTYAPEGFYEFYNQRRRWTPSTMANILDLLMDWKNVTTRNNDISMLYIAYQMLLMVSSILTPGTIFLLILGAISLAYPDLPLYGSMLLNLIPVALFILLTFVAKGNHQLAYAAILSTIYSLIMMLVLVGLLKQASENGFCSVTTVFLCFVAGVFVVSAFLHPQEFWCIIHGFLYFLAIPSMSMLLMLYSLGNLHVVSWGTREAPKPAAALKPGEKKTPPTKTGAVHDWLEKLGFADSVGSSDYMFSFGNLFKCICCPQETKHAEDIKLRAILDRLDDLEVKLLDHPKSHVTGISLSSDHEEDHVVFSETSDLFEGVRQRDNPLFQDEARAATPWTSDPDLRESATETLKQEETTFWKELINTYLYPLEGDKKQEEKMQGELLELRNKVCLFFLLINALFVTIVFTLQQVSATSSTLSIDLPCATGNYGESIEPISIAFTLIFGILLLIQFICMMFHRMSTFLHICAITEVKIRSPRQLKNKDDELSVEKGLTLIRDMQVFKDEDSKSVLSEDDDVFKDPHNKDELEEKRQREVWDRLTRKRKKKATGTLNENFVRNLQKLQRYIDDDEQGGKDTLRVPKVSFTDPDDDPEVLKLKTIRKRFRRFSRSSVFTIKKITEDQRVKDAIKQRKPTVAYKWRKAAVQARFKNAQSNAARDSTDGRPTSNLSMADAAMLVSPVNQNSSAVNGGASAKM